MDVSPFQDIGLQLFLLCIGVAGPLAVLRLAVAGLKVMAGDPEAVPKAIREIVIGLVVIITSQAVVHFVEAFAKRTATVFKGW